MLTPTLSGFDNLNDASFIIQSDNFQENSRDLIKSDSYLKETFIFVELLTPTLSEFEILNYATFIIQRDIFKRIKIFKRDFYIYRIVMLTPTLSGFEILNDATFIIKEIYLKKTRYLLKTFIFIEFVC